MYRVGRAPVMRPCGAIRREMHRFQDHGGIPAENPRRITEWATIAEHSSCGPEPRQSHVPRTAAEGGQKTDPTTEGSQPHPPAYGTA